MNKHAEVQEKDPYIDIFVLRQECDAAFAQNCGGIIVNTHPGTFGHLLKILLYICSCRIQGYLYIQHLNHICVFPDCTHQRLKEKKKSNLITKVSIFYHAQTTNNSYFTMREGPHILNLLRNVDRRRSETKEVLSKKITQHARYKTCTFLSCPTQEKKNVK